MKGVNQVATANFLEMVHVLQAIMYIKTLAFKDLNMADFGMMEMMNIKLLEGRYNSIRFRHHNNIMVNETAVKI
jgi:hypothetical protein